MPPIPAAVSPLDYESARLAPGKGGLIGISVLFFLIGAMTACGTLTMPLAMLSGAGRGGPDVATLVMVLVFYGIIAVASIWTGVGCCRARRWVRPVVLAVAWPALLMGCVGVVTLIVVLVQMQAQLAGSAGPAGAGMPRAALTAMLIIPAAMGVLFYVGIPALLVWFFQRRQTAQTLWFYDPVPGWADRCPIPVFAWSLWTGLGALGMLSAMAHSIVPVFGVIVTGIPAAGIIVFTAAVLGCAAVGAYLLKPWAWWLSLAQTLVLSASWLTLLLRGRLPDYFAQITARMQPMPTTGPSFQFQQTSMINSPWMIGASLVGMLLWIGFLVYVRRYFAAPPTAASGTVA